MVMRDGTAWRSLAKINGYKGWDCRDKVTGVLRNLLKACRFSAISLVLPIKKRIFATDIMNYNKGDCI